MDRDATDRIQADPAFIRTESEIVAHIQNLEGYGEVPLTVPLSETGVDLNVQLGGQRDSFRDITSPRTWGVARNELTWLLRHAQLDGTAHVDASGDITIDYTISDTLDLRPGDGRGTAYNLVTGGAGFVWHDVLGAEEASVTGDFTSTPALTG